MRAASVLLAFGVLGATARADVALRVAPEGGRLVAGRPVAIALTGLSESVEESELYLVPAPGLRPLRLTGSEEREALLLVSLPNLALPHAVLRLRAGDGAREWWAAESVPFTLETSPFAPAAAVNVRQDEEWLVDDDPVPAPAARRGESDRMLELASPAPALAWDDDDPAPPGSGERATAPTRTGSAPPPLRGVAALPGSFQVPLRN